MPSAPYGLGSRPRVSRAGAVLPWAGWRTVGAWGLGPAGPGRRGGGWRDVGVGWCGGCGPGPPVVCVAGWRRVGVGWVRTVRAWALSSRACGAGWRDVGVGWVRAVGACGAAGPGPWLCVEWAGAMSGWAESGWSGACGGCGPASWLCGVGAGAMLGRVVEVWGLRARVPVVCVAASGHVAWARVPGCGRLEPRLLRHVRDAGLPRPALAPPVVDHGRVRRGRRSRSRMGP